MMRPAWPFVLVLTALAGCASSTPDIRRLTPVEQTSTIPTVCTLVSVLPGSPAARAGLEAGDVIQAVNGIVPKNAEEMATLVARSPDTMQLRVVPASGAPKAMEIALNKVRPRLGAVCDLAGWRKPGLTPAGNESLTVFGGPLSFTASGIFEKGLAFMRVHIANNGNNPLQVDPSTQFLAYDADRNRMPIMTPHEVMCFLYGDKGARYLATRLKQKHSFDISVGFPEDQMNEETCAGFSAIGHVSGADVQYAQANAEYLATESLWPTVVKPGDAVDGLIYLHQPTALPLTLDATLGGQELEVSFGEPKASTGAMTTSELAKFFSHQNKGTPVRVTTRKGQVLVAKFLEYDDDNERAWFESNSGLLNSLSYPLANLRSAEVIDQLPAKNAPAFTP